MKIDFIYLNSRFISYSAYSQYVGFGYLLKK